MYILTSQSPATFPLLSLLPPAPPFLGLCFCACLCRKDSQEKLSMNKSALCKKSQEVPIQ